MDRLHPLLLTSLLFFSVQVFGGVFSPGYPSAYRYFPELAGALDKDFDGLLSYDELIEGYHAPYLNKDLYQTIRLYLVNFESWQNPVTASLSRESIELAELSGRVAKYHHEQDNTFWEAWLAKPERQPFADGYRRLFPQGLTSITPDNLLQGYFPDCVLIATLASIVSSETGKRLAFNYFYPFDEQTFEIVFPGIAKREVIQFREVERYSHFAETRDGGIWLAMLEAAYAHLSKKYYNVRGRNDRARFEYHQYSELVQVQPPLANEALMNSPSGHINPQFESQDLLKMLLNSFVDDEKAAIFFITSVLSAPLKLRPFEGIGPRHAYSLIGYDKEKEIVYIRDPHGRSDAVESLLTINRHIQPASSENKVIYEYMASNPSSPDYGFALGLTESLITVILNQTFPKALAAGQGVIPLNIARSKPTAERSPARTGIIEITIQQVIDTFNFMYVSRCGPYQCPNDE
ncbi:hypothetical protein [Endozoicomonas sp. ALC020]|uniref:hypothetical protein n=1 Tax=unclassified Endozoicomonas TaxID=2644528 RepID=UPI003BB0F53F